MSRSDKSPTAVDLFAGAGGLSEGLKQAGYRVLGAVEYDSTAARSYRLNHPATHLEEADIRSVAATRFMRTLKMKPGSLTLLAGCPPCQGFSRMRTKNGQTAVDDARNSLVGVFVRFARALRPKFIMIENVPGLQRESVLRETLSRLRKLGYKSTTKVLDAASYGVPQRRKRLVVLAGRTSVPEMPPASKEERTVRDTISSLPPPGSSGDELHDMKSTRAPHVVEIIRAVPKDGGSRSSVPAHLLPKCHQNHKGHYDVYGRMSWDAVSPTITGGCHNPSRGRFLHPEQNRSISLREAALLQTFPPSYKFSTKRGKEHIALQIGNALPPEMIRRIGASILKAKT